MKHISAAIIVAASLATIAAGSFTPHGDTGMFVMTCGVLAGAIGLITWLMTLRGQDL